MNEPSGNDFNTVEARNVAGGNKKKSLVLEELEDDSNDYSPLGVLKVLYCFGSGRRMLS